VEGLARLPGPRSFHSISFAYVLDVTYSWSEIASSPPVLIPPAKGLGTIRSPDRSIIMLSQLKNCAVRFLVQEDGPTAVEYAVMLALIIVVCIAAITTLGNNANSTFGGVGTAIGSGS
jgi:pilus assembly protein Flp/PilA